MKQGSIDLSLLDEKVEELCAKMLLTFPDCTTKTLEELRKPKLEAWNRNKEDSRAWLALNMVTEARAGFTAFNEGPKDDREVDFVAAAPEDRRRRALGRRSCTTRSSRGKRARHERDARSRSGWSATARCSAAPGAAQGQHHRRGDDRRARQAFAAHRDNTGLLAALRRPRGAAFLLRRRAWRSTCRSAARTCSSSLHALLGAMLEWPRPILVAARGQCLGGGLELALAGSLLFVAPDAQLRAAGNQARRVRARRLGAAAAAHRPGARRGPAATRAARSTAPRARGLGPRERGWRTIRRSPRWRTSRSTSPARAPRRSRYAVRAAREPFADAGARAPRRRGGAVPRETDGARATRTKACSAFLEKRAAEMGAPMSVQDIVERCEGLFEDLDFNAVKQWKAAAPGAQGDRLHADLRAARDRPRRGHAAGGHLRRRRPARGDPGRRLLPELHLPHPALDARARASPGGSTASTACCSRRSAT